MNSSTFVKPSSDAVRNILSAISQDETAINNRPWVSELLLRRPFVFGGEQYTFAGAEEFSLINSDKLRTSKASTEIHTIYLLSKQYMIVRKYVKHSVVFVAKNAKSNSKAVLNALESLPNLEHRVGVSYWRDGVASRDIVLLINLDEKRVIGEFTPPMRRSDYTEWFDFWCRPQPGTYIYQQRQPSDISNGP